MVFSAPRSPREALHLSENLLYLQQWLRRNIERRPSRHRLHSDLNADWSVSMGTGATVGAGRYPAKFSFSATTESPDSAGSERRAFASVQPGLRGFDQGSPGFGPVVNARSFGKTAVVIHDDAACSSGSGQRGAAGIDRWKAIGDV